MPIALDFTGVESSARMAPGKHVVTISKIETKNAQSSGQPMLVVTYKDAGGATVNDNFVLVPQALWKLKIFLEAVFQTPFTAKINFEPSTLLNKRLTINVYEEDYIATDGTTKKGSRVSTDYAPISVDAGLGSAPVADADGVIIGAVPSTPVAPVAATPAPAPAPVPAAQVAPTPVVAAAPVAPAQPVQPAAAPAPQPAPAPARPKLPWE